MDNRVKVIASRIKGLRLLQEISQAEAAKALGLSLEEYVKFEDGLDDVPASLLYEIADFYNVDMTEILTGVSPKLRDVSLVKKGEGLRVERYDQYEFQSLAFKFANRKMEPFYVVLDPEKDPDFVSHKGHEFNFCLKGRMKVVIGKEEYVLEPGDALYFNSINPHKMLPLDGEKAEFLTIITLR